MAKCVICDKAMLTGHKLSVTRSRVSRRANRTWKPNVKKIKIVDDNGTTRSIHVCTGCLRDNRKNKKFTRAI